MLFTPSDDTAKEPQSNSEPSSQKITPELLDAARREIKLDNRRNLLTAVGIWSFTAVLVVSVITFFFPERIATTEDLNSRILLSGLVIALGIIALCVILLALSEMVNFLQRLIPSYQRLNIFRESYPAAYNKVIEEANREAKERKRAKRLKQQKRKYLRETRRRTAHQKIREEFAQLAEQS